MNYQHPTVVIVEPAPGHYVIKGHAPKSVYIKGEGHIVPSPECYIAPEVPTSALVAVLEARGVQIGGPIDPVTPPSEESSLGPRSRRSRNQEAGQ